MDGGNGRGRRQGIRLGESWELTACMGALLEKTLTSSLCRKLWGAHVDIHPLRRVQYSICSRTRPATRPRVGTPPKTAFGQANPVQSL